jgi:hypothetical protein
MKELIIPVRLETEQAKHGMQELGQSGRKAGEDIGEGFQGAGAEVLKFIGITSGLDMGKRVIEAMGEGIKQASEYATNAAKAFISLQESLRQIAALSGAKLDDKLAQDVIDRAKKSGILTPNEVQQAMTEWNKGGSGYVISPENPQGRIEESLANQLQDEFMAYGKAHGVTPATSMYWLSTLVQKLPKGTSADNFRKIFYESMKIARMARGSEDATISQVSEVVSGYVGEGMAFGEGEKGILEALTQTGVQQETHPGSAGHYEKDLLMFFDRLATTPDKEQALGIGEDMTIRQKLEKVAEAWKKSNVKFSKFIQEYVKGHGNIQQKLALQTAIQEGVKSGRFGAWDEMIAKSDFKEEQAAVESFKTETRVGRKYGRAAEEESALMEHGKEFADVQEIKEEIAKNLKVEGYEAEPFKEGIMDTLRYAASVIPYVGGRIEQIQRRALYEKLEQHAFGGAETVAAQQEAFGYTFSGRTQEQEAKRLLELAAQREGIDQASILREILQELRQSRGAHERAASSAERTEKRPLPAPMPPPEPPGARP